MDLVNEAFGLFIETLPLESMGFDHPKFEELYEKECQIFTLLRKMSEKERDEYRQKTVELINDHN